MMRSASGHDRRRTATDRYGAAREQAILQAVVELLVEVGYDELTIDSVAARAHASKTTIYSRWQGKAALVRAAVAEAVTRGARRAEAAATLRDDLLATMRGLRSFLSPEFVSMMRGLVQAMRNDSELAALLRPVFDDEVASRAIVARAVARGELPRAGQRRAAALIHELIEGQILRRLFVLDEPLNEEFARHVVDDILMPVLTRGAADMPQGTRGTGLPSAKATGGK